MIVDVHCHTFNADDLPIRGFLHRVAFDNDVLATDIATLVDVLIQGRAPGYETEIRELDALLSATSDGYESASSAVGAAELELDEETDMALSQLQVTHPQLVRRLGTEMALTYASHEVDAEESPADWVEGIRRGIKWVKLFGMSRLGITNELTKNFANRVDLYVPLVVDLGIGLLDQESTTVRQQIELQEKISRLSMLARLPGDDHARIHPFVGFDPRRELKARRTGDVEGALDLVKAAVEKYGFIGVKLYPPMGFRPIGNEMTIDMNRSEAGEVEDILIEFYGWCEAEEVPITVHCNASNAAHPSFIEFSSPKLWEKVLRKFPQLHLNLGHFGGARASEKPGGWPWQIARLATEDYPYLHADVGNHRIDRPEVLAGYLETLDQMFTSSETSGMRDRIMYGSDWYMLAALPSHEDFLDAYEESYRNRFGDAPTENFLGLSALRFLGFDDPRNKNTQRLTARYKTYAPDDVPMWLALS